MPGFDIGGGAVPPPIRSRLLVVEAPWCAECKRMAPLIDAVAAEHPGVEIERIDATADLERARSLGVLGTPTLIGFVDGSEVARARGRRGRRELESLFAGLEAGTVPVRAPGSPSEVAVGVGAGALVAGIGVLAGPAWPLVIVGALIVGYGLAGTMRKR